jgi:hypothetical protein
VIRTLLVTVTAVSSLAFTASSGQTSLSASTSPSVRTVPAEQASRTGPAGLADLAIADLHLAPRNTAPGNTGPRTTGPGTTGPRDTGVIPAGVHVQLSPDRLRSAAARCAAWASQAGFANNGYLGGSLTTAVAIALAESGCNPAACYNDSTGRECTRAGTRHSRDSIDRGAWQVNSRAWPRVSNSCAYSGRCNGRAAYRRVSAFGTYFGPWTTYLTDRFAGYLWAAQRAVNSLRRGTLTSALIGSCAARRGDGRVVLANCGSAAASQQWRLAGSRIHGRSGDCLSAGRRGAVTVRRCTGGRRQDWQQHAGWTLYNVGTRRCLTDRGSSLRPGHRLVVGSCAKQQNKAWFRP